jgi:tetratricopeptide (TPR) repeat protein
MFHSFYNQPRVDIALEQIVRSFGEEPAPTPFQAAQRTLAARQALLVLDGAERADDLRGILGVRGGCGVLVTGRDGPPEPDARLHLDALPLAEAVALLQAWGEFFAREEQAAQRLCELVGRLPLAIRLAGQYLAVQAEPVADYLSWLEETALPNYSLAQRQSESVALILERSLARLDDNAQDTLAVVGLLAQYPFDAEAVVAALMPELHNGVLSAIRRMFGQVPLEKSSDIMLGLEALVKLGLLRQFEDKYEVSHPLIHAFARRKLTAPAKTIRRLATHYVGLTWEQGQLGPEGLVVLDAHRPHFMRVLAECIEWEEWSAAHGLAVAVEDYLDSQGCLTERIMANEIGLIAAWKLDRPTHAAWMGNIGDTYRTLGQAEVAIEFFREALASARRVGDWRSEGNWLGNLGLAYRDLGDIVQARQYLKESQAIFEEIQSPRAALVQGWLAELEAGEDQ